MAKAVATTVLDADLDLIATATEMYVCEGQPVSRADAISKSAVPAITMASGDFAKANGGGGRRLTVAAKTGTLASASRPVDHVALCTDSTLLAVTVCPAQNANSGSPVNVASFTIDSPNPT